MRNKHNHIGACKLQPSLPNQCSVAYHPDSNYSAVTSSFQTTGSTRDSQSQIKVIKYDLFRYCLWNLHSPNDTKREQTSFYSAVFIKTILIYLISPNNAKCKKLHILRVLFPSVLKKAYTASFPAYIPYVWTIQFEHIVGSII